MPEPKPVSVGVIGTGGMGSRHVANLQRFVPAADVVAVYDLDPQRAGRAAGPAQVFSDPLALIRDERVEAVIVASPDDTHVEFVLECLRANKPVLCEKPLATGSAEAARVIAAEAAQGQRLVSVGFMRRFDPQHRAVKQTIESGNLGRAILYKGFHRNVSIPYSVSGEMVITNSAGHDMDAARWLLGQEVEEVYVRGVRSHDRFSPETTDLLLFQLGLSGGCLAAIEVYVAAEYGYEVYAEVVGEHGSAATLPPERALLRLSGNHSTPVPADWLERFQEAYVAELIDWVASVRSGRPFAGASAWDGYMALLISDACVESFRSGLPVKVALPEGNGQPRIGTDGHR